jgi:hypothetical protein
MVLVGAAVLLWVLRHHGWLSSARVLLALERALGNIQKRGP